MSKIAPISPKIQRFIELERKKEAVKKYYEELNSAIAEVAEEIGVDTFFKDPSDNTVYQIVIPDGTFVAFKKVDYIRTKREGEVRGSLSKKKADEAFGS